MKTTRAALVTGSSRGIGRAVALALGKAGYAVTVNYIHNADAAAEVVARIAETGGQAIAVQGSVADTQARQQLLDETLAAFGRLDLLVNNAGITSQGRQDILNATQESWDLVFDTNLKGPFFLTQLVANWMKSTQQTQQSAARTIVNISSISGFAVSTNRADYCLTKAALQMMTWLFASRLAEDGIHVYEICPGIIATDMTAAVRDKYDRLINDGLTPIRRWGEGIDIAKAVLSLDRGDFPFTTGQRVYVDGGFHIRQL